MKVILSGYYGFKNFGDEAILSILVSKLKSLNTDITVITASPEYTKSLYNNISTVYTFDIWKILYAILKSDVLISGGGSLLQDVTGIKSLIYYLFIIFHAKLFGKKVIIFAQGIGPIRSKFGEFLTINILKLCNYISVRDENSLNFLHTKGIRNVELVNDPIFSIQTPKIENRNTVGIQLRGFKTMNGDFIDRLAQKVNENFSNKKIKIYSFQDSIDLETCNAFKKALTLLNENINVELISNLTNEGIIEEISACEYLIGMRFHSLIIGLLAGAKTLAINYDIKVKTLAEEFSIPYVNLSGDFEDKFKQLNQQNQKIMQEKARLKTFNWLNFDKSITQ